MDLPYAEDLNYWKTSQAAADTWIDKTIDLIERMGGQVLTQAFGSEQSGRSAYMLTFTIQGESYRLIWPVLPTRSGKPADTQAARRQAATLLYHDTKSKCLKALVFGARTAFFEYLLLEDGRTAGQVSNQDLVALSPAFLLPTGVRNGNPGS